MEIPGRSVLPRAGGQNPASKTFSTKPGTGIALETLKRGKSTKGKSSISENVVSVDDSSLPPATGIHGKWVIVSGAQDGLDMEPFMIKTGKRVATAAELKVSFAGQVMVQAQYKTDNPRNPKTMDYVHHRRNAQRQDTNGNSARCKEEFSKFASASRGKPFARPIFQPNPVTAAP